MSPQEIFERLGELLGKEADLRFEAEQAGDPWVEAPPAQWRRACQSLRDDEELAFDFLRSLCAVDRPERDELELVVHLFSYRHRHATVVKTRLPRTEGRAPTLSDFWPAANWHEREVFDLFGLRFENHPDLRRLLMPEDWVGHPLLKDYQEAESYRGIPTSRPGYPITRGIK